VTRLLSSQQQFFSMLAALYEKARTLGLPLKQGCGLCQDAHHSRNSLHKISLAVDLPLIWPDGSYGTWEHYRPLGEFWESIGGSWGGRFDLNMDGVAKDDANHFSLAYGGRR